MGYMTIRLSKSTHERLKIYTIVSKSKTFDGAIEHLLASHQARPINRDALPDSSEKDAMFV